MVTRKVRVHCNKCNGDAMLDIGTATIAEIQETMRSRQGFHCNIGSHVELGRQSDYWTIDPNSLIEEEQSTDEEWFIQNGADKYYNTAECTAEFEINTFAAPCCIGKRKSTGSHVVLRFGAAPSGERYYWVLKES